MEVVAHYLGETAIKLINDKRSGCAYLIVSYSGAD